ncbi:MULTISPECIES: plasmid replication protein RepC [unclassified Sinorhizobium]|uniref:plasmid replication protein RepC n=1 Tax=unclassified Sinorhizobium TaxID=2613772 RepID=UPI0024C441D7|nr:MULTISPECIES: plasmid replication protein RepC [unclassified Sinorhizobium]MDK1376417.1 plasmid replication protein RepC [Sinorhizobium sp. 6-70]MDK1479966.1 plasmid replication protein RepC [Sinorhizobium sp. 6-117]
MQSEYVTTPFGRRPITLALVKRQIDTKQIKSGKSADKWKIFRDVSQARELLGLQDRSLAILDALLSFYPENELRQDAQLVVFPSNAQLALRAHGIAGATLRRHLALLVEAGLILRRDSANGKRYARKSKTGEIESAFGFDLSPLLMRAEELVQMAQQVAADRNALRRAKENLTICRRDVRKLITAAIEEGADGDWAKIEALYVDLVRRIPRTPSMSDLDQLLDEITLLQDEILNTLDLQENAKILSTNDAHNERHIQNSHTESISELEPSSRNEQEAKWSPVREMTSERIKTFPLGMVLKACPQIADYAPGGAVANWRDLMSAAIVVRSVLKVSPSAYEDACHVMGRENASVIVACILERAEHINSAGGYLRDLTSKAKRGEFSLGPVLMALLRANGQGGKKAG